MDFIDLKSQYQRLKPKMDERIQRVLDHGQYILGPEVAELEAALCRYTGAKHCISLANGTDSLLVSLMALGVKAGDEVITSPFTFISNGEMIALLGARPVFVDIDPRTYNMDPKKLEKKITSKTKAIMPVSLYGQCADMDGIQSVAEKYPIPVIEDAAQSFGAKYKGRFSCNLSTIGSTSFFPSKPLGAYGDAGACFTNDDALAERMKQIRVHGQDRRYHHPVLGLNARMDTLQAAILLTKLEVFEEECVARERLGRRYSELLEGAQGVVTPFVEDFNRSVYAQYTVKVKNRDSVQKKLQARGIPTAVHYPIPLNLQPVFASLKEGPGSYPESEDAGPQVMSLPMHPYLTDAQQQLIASALMESVQGA
jgi:UDP-2-acetamido-2-deoxy-ribo-hexuluronate aminotransferase